MRPITIMRILLLSMSLLTVNPQSSARTVVESLQEIRTRHVILQRWELSCAAAALATILRYQYDLPVTERSVALGLINRPAYFANPDLVRQRRGFSLLDMKRFTARLGFEGVGLGQMTFDDLLQRAPVIVPINVDDYPHFVVFRGATNHSVLLADPAFGNVTLSRHRFNQYWIQYRQLGHIGFVVSRHGRESGSGMLRAPSTLFPILR